MTRLIAFSGRKQSGKNTCANVLFGIRLLELGIVTGFDISPKGELIVTEYAQENSPAPGILNVYTTDIDTQVWLCENVYPSIKLYSFADTLKQVVCNDLFNLPWEMVYGDDDAKNELTPYRWENMPGYVEYGEKTGLMTGREFMQFIGTDVLRKIYPAFHIDKTLACINEEQPEIAMITDCRFPDEVLAVKNAGGHVVRLTRHQHVETEHSSESMLDRGNFEWDQFDLVVDNDGLSLQSQQHNILKVGFEFQILHSKVGEDN